MKSRAASFCFDSLRSRDGIGDFGSLVDGHFVDDLYFLGNSCIGLSTKPASTLPDFDRSQGRADILHRHDLWLDWWQKLFVGQVFVGVDAYRNGGGLGERDPFDVVLQ